jgi:hypothetical protein
MSEKGSGGGKQIGIRFDAPLLSELERRAQADDRTVSSLVRLLCRRGLQQPQTERAA